MISVNGLLLFHCLCQERYVQLKSKSKSISEVLENTSTPTTPILHSLSQLPHPTAVADESVRITTFSPGSVVPICSMSCGPDLVTSGSSLSQELLFKGQPGMREMNYRSLRLRTGQLPSPPGCSEGWKCKLAFEMLAMKWRRGNFPF